MISTYQQKPDRKSRSFSTLLVSLTILFSIVFSACSQLAPLPENLLDSDRSITNAIVTGSNGSVTVTNMSNNNLTVTYSPDQNTPVDSAKIYISEGNGNGLVAASQNMNLVNGEWTFSYNHPTFTDGAKISLDILILSSGIEQNIPQGVLGDVTTWASFIYGEEIEGHKVSFDGQGATTEASPSSIIVVDPATTVENLPSDPIRNGYIFKGWFTQTNGQGEAFDQNSEVTADVTVYAFWEKKEGQGDGLEVSGPNGTIYITEMSNNSLTVTYTPDSDITSARLFVSEGNGIGLVLASQQMDNQAGSYTYTYSHPTFVDDAKIYINILQNQNGIETNIPQGELSNTSSWGNFIYGTVIYSYDVTFDSQGADIEASPSTMQVSSPANSVDSLPTAPIKNGEVFGGWFTEPNGSGTQFTDSTIVNSDITLYAYWFIPTNCIVTFDDQGATTPVNPSTIEVLQGSKLTTLPTQPEKTDFSFRGWNSKSDGTGETITSETVILDDTTVYAIWKTKNQDEYNWQLVWSDEFNDGIFDESKWTREEMAPQTVNFEWQEYVSSEYNSWEEDGNMILKLSYDGPTRDIGNYSSARINSADKFEFTYGKISARIRVDYMEQGVWPAFWLLGASCDEYGGDVPWPECGEVDILEIIGGTDATSGKDREKEAWSTMHWCTPPGPDLSNENIGRKYENGMLVLDEKIWGEEYHIYEVIWDEEYISASIDGNVYFTANIEDVDKSEFHEDFFIIFNIACGGNWPGDPTLEQDVNMYIDWVRVYQEDPTEDYVREAIPLRNGTFDTSAEYWQPIGFNWEYGWPGGWDMTRASYDIVNSEYVCDLIYAAENWNPKIRQIGLTLFDQHEYTLKFDARSIGSGRTIYVELGPTERDLGAEGMYINESVQLSTTMQSYEYTFTATDTIYNGGLFFLVGQQNVDVVLDNVELIDNTDPSMYE